MLKVMAIKQFLKNIAVFQLYILGRIQTSATDFDNGVNSELQCSHLHYCTSTSLMLKQLHPRFLNIRLYMFCSDILHTKHFSLS